MRKTGSSHQDNQHGVLQLGDEPLQQSGLFGFLELVGAVLGQAFFSLGGGQALSPYAEILQNFFCRLGIGFFMFFLLLKIVAYPWNGNYT